MKDAWKFCLLGCVLTVGMASGTVHAQSNGEDKPRPAPPSRPPLSAYLNLARENSGVLPSYQAFVLPNLEQNRQMMNQWMLQMQTQRLAGSTPSEPGLRQTGHGGKFQNHLHFYPAPSNKR